MHPCSNPSQQRREGRFAILLAVAMLLTLPTPLKAQSPYDQTGRWTQPNDDEANWGHNPWHMALLPGDASYHSYILSWHHNSDGGPTWFGGLWGWNPPSPADNLGVYPAATVDQLPQPTSPFSEIGCSGHSALPDGRLLVTGGGELEVNGNPDVRIFDPQTKAWITEQPMAFKRYYPTNTTLPDGRVLVTHGWQHFNLLTFGGRTTPSDPQTARDEIQRLAITSASTWDQAKTNPQTDPWPDRRADHTAVMTMESNPVARRMLVFGGTGTNGVARNDTWQLTRSQWNDDEEVYEWQEIANDGSAPSRARHGTVFAKDGKMYTFGGINQLGVVQSAVYEMRKIGQQWTWEEVQGIQGPPPGARYGHAVAYDTTASRSRMIVFGGRTSATALADDDVYLLDLVTLQWSQHNIPGPAAREGHTLLPDPGKRKRLSATPTDNWGRVMLYGGETATGRDGQVWTLWVSPTDASVSWQQANPADDPDDGAPAFSRHSAAWHSLPTSGGKWMGIFGGTGNPGSEDDVWVLDVTWPSNGNESQFFPAWTRHPASGVALSGHTALRDEIPLEALKPEVYDPGQPQRWTTLDAPKRYDYYPSMFVLPTGNVFMATRKTESWILKMTASPPAWDPNIKYSTFYVPEAVMYRPGKIMKCLVDNDHPSQEPQDIDTETIDLSTLALEGTSQWVGSNGFEDRRDHNLTLLPNGRVIATGGKTPDGTGFRRGPQIWDPDRNGQPDAWTEYGELMDEPINRRHHSAAILLPDGRTLSGSEHDQFPEDLRFRTTIYAPPYLFTPSGLAARPTISSAPSTVGYGESFTICTPEAATVSSVSIVKPSAVTHEFNHDQRYVPLTIQQPGCQQLTVASPANGSLAPPGYYLLFLVNTQGTPSIGKWIKVTGSPPAGDRRSPDCTTDLVPWLVGKYSVLLNWTATGDDGQIGTASSFTLKRSTTPINASNFDAATTVPTPSPGPPGTVHCAEALNLNSCTTYYFALKTSDEASNKSCLSNLPSATTTCSGPSHVCFEGGLLAEGWGEGGWDSENSLFGETGGQGAVDLYLMKGTPGPASGEYRTRLVKGGEGQAVLDEVRLGTVDHDAGVTVLRGADRAYLGSLMTVEKVTDGSGTDVTSLLESSNDEPYHGEPGQTLTVKVGTTSSNTALVIESAAYRSRVHPDSSGILVQEPDGLSWKTLERIQPRKFYDRRAVETKGREELRLVFLGEHDIRSIARMSVNQEQHPSWLTLERAEHSRLGDVKAAVGSSGGTTSTLEMDDALVLGFKTTAVPTGKTRAFFLEARGDYTALATARASTGDFEAAQPSYEFSLGAAHPNPTSGVLNIHYTLARESVVSLRIYNVAGKLVRSLVSERQTPGQYQVTWSLQDEGGGRVPTGVYFYRLVADEWTSQKKVVFVDR